MTGEVGFFSIGVADADKARRFYGALFGWTFSEPPSGTGAVVETSTVPGGIHGGDPGARPYLFFGVEDIAAAITRVRDLNGEVVQHDPSDDPASAARFGRFALCEDDQGSMFGLHEPPGQEPSAPSR